MSEAVNVENVENGEATIDPKYAKLLESPDVQAMLDRILERTERKFHAENTLVLQAFNPAFKIDIDLPSGDAVAHAPPASGKRGNPPRQYEFVLPTRDAWFAIQELGLQMREYFNSVDKRLLKLSGEIKELPKEIDEMKRDIVKASRGKAAPAVKEA